jgi:uncharacterized protein with ParB-like and HNH nuclease domain
MKKNPNIFIFTAGDKNARKHLDDSVISSIKYSLINFHLDSKFISRISSSSSGSSKDEFFAWGAVEGPVNIRNWNKIQSGDYILCVFDNKYQYISKVLDKTINKQLATNIWGLNHKGKTWEYMYFFDKPIKIDIPVKSISNDFMFAKYLGFTSISKERVKNIISKYQSIDVFIKEKFLDHNFKTLKKIVETDSNIEMKEVLKVESNKIKREIKPIGDIMTKDTRPTITFDAEKSNLGKSFFTQDNIFEIPRYQRPYSWGKDQINEFWNDLNDDDSNFFIGSVIFNDANLEKYNIIQVIDGQQRLLTSTIFTRALIDVFNEFNPSTAGKMHQRDILFENTENFENEYRLKPGLSTRSFFQDYIQDGKRKHGEDSFTTLNDTQAIIKEKSELDKLSKEERLIWDNYRTFKGFIEEYLSAFDSPEEKTEQVGKLSKKLRNLGIVEITVQSDDAAYEIFETTNARGLDLSVTDLLKNHIFRKIPEENGKDVAMQKWNHIVENVEKAKGEMSQFIRHYWLSKYGFVEMKKLFREIKFGENKVTDWSIFLDDLAESSNLYRLISIDNEAYLEEYLGNCENEKIVKDSSKIAASIRHIRKMNIIQHKVYLLSILRNLNTLNYNPCNSVRVLENFCYMFYKVCQLRGVKVEKLFSKYAVIIENSSDSSKSSKKRQQANASAISSFIQELKDLKPDEETFKVNFKSLKYNDRGENFLISYTLQMIDYFLMGSDEELVHNIDQLSIEHILPQNPTKWDLTEEETEEYVHNVGNLTLLSRRINGMAKNNKLLQKNSNGDEVGKLAVYENSDLEITKRLVKRIMDHENKWDEEVILERNEYFAEIAFDEIWDF